MRISRCCALGAAVVIAAAGCAGPQSSLGAAKKACDRALDHLTSAEGCDAYVAAALQSNNKDEVFDAYTNRALLREFRDDLPGALADADQAIDALPQEPFGHRRRAALLGESGEYAAALELFAKFPSAATTGFEENIAMLEYVAGDRAKSVSLFQAAAADYAKNDNDVDMAAIHRFTAAIIESELNNDGDLAPIAAQDVSARTNTMLPLLKQHRLGEMTDAELIARVDTMSGSAARENLCDGYFSVGHRNAVAGNSAAAREAFGVAVSRCSVVTFEHHAARAWLNTLGG